MVRTEALAKTVSGGPFQNFHHGGKGGAGAFSELALPGAGNWPSMTMRPDTETCGGCGVSMSVTRAVSSLRRILLIRGPHRHSREMSRLASDAPRGKLPYIEDSDGTKVPDSNEIIAYLKSKYGDPLDADLSRPAKADGVAWTRLCDEHLYWSGLIEPRWRMESGWRTFVPFLARGAEISSELERALAGLREHILREFEGHGMGRRSSADVFAVFKADTRPVHVSTKPSEPVCVGI